MTTAPGGAPDELATQAELGHLAYILADLRLLYEQGKLRGHIYAQLASRYEARQRQLLGQLPGAPLPPAETAARPDGPARDGAAALPPPPPAAARQPLEPAAVLLWLGAFLVTVASLIFVGYSWALLSGPVKTLIMAGLTGGFLAAGRLALRKAALRPAGQTFVAIGAALAPLTFVAAYNFWLAEQGLRWQLLGLVAALASTALYGRLALALGGRLYPVATLLAAGAAAGYALAAVELPGEWWPAVATLLALLLWTGGERWATGRLDCFRRPAAGLGLAILAGALLSLPLLADSSWSLAAALAGLALNAALAATRRRQGALAGLALLAATPAAAIAAGELAGGTALAAALGGVESAVALALLLLAGLALAGLRRMPPLWAAVLRPYAVLVGLGAPWLAAAPGRPLAGTLGLAVTLLAGIVWRGRQPGWLWTGALALPAGYGALAGTLGEAGQAWSALVFCWLAALGPGVAAVRAARPVLLYAAGLLVAIGLVAVASAPGLTPLTQTLGTGATGWALAGLGLGLSRRWPSARQPLLESGAALATMAALAGAVAGGGLLAPGSPAVPALLLLAGLLGLLAASEQRAWLAEAATGVALLALLVQLGQWGRDNIQWYSVPLAAWLAGLALARGRRGQAKLASALLAAAVLALLGPTLVQGLVDPEGWRYALVAGGEALALLAAGLRWQLRVPVAGGALGLSLIAGRQVFDSVRSLPAWAIIGLLGLLLLATALALLLRCDDLGRAGSGLRSRWQTWR
jgi:hypothetical protein